MRIYLSALRLYDVLYANENFNPFLPNILIAYNLDKTKNNNDAVELINNPIVYYPSKTKYSNDEFEQTKYQIYKSLMIDSGAYVANVGRLTNSKDFDSEKSFQELCDFYRLFYGKINMYFNYDILFRGPNSFPVNKMYFERMIENGLDPIFVIHSFEQHEIDFILNLNPTFVSIASANLTGKNIDKALEVTDIFYDAGIKVHLLGCASYEILSKSKAWSCDASSYVQWVSVGRLIYYSSKAKKEIPFTLNKFDKKDNYNSNYIDDEDMKIYKDEYIEFIEKISGIQFCELEANDNLHKIANAYYMVELEKKITEIQIKNGIDFTQDKFKIKNKNNMPDW